MPDSYLESDFGAAFDPSLYKRHIGANNPYYNYKFKKDLATCCIEHGRGNPTRVVPFAQIADFDTKTVRSADPKYGNEPNIKIPGDPLYFGTERLFALLTDPSQYQNGRLHIVHLSPPDPEVGFPSGRITIYAAQINPDGKSARIQAYGSIGCDSSWPDYQSFALRLSGVLFPSPSQMRDFPLVVDTDGQDFLDFLKAKLPKLKSDWDSISSGLAEEFFAQVLSETMRIPKAAILRMIATGMIGIAHDYLRGRSVNLADTQCATSFPKPETAHFDGSRKKFIRNCGQCGAKLNRYMAKGDQCPRCRGVYLGC